MKLRDLFIYIPTLLFFLLLGLAYMTQAQAGVDELVLKRMIIIGDVDLPGVDEQELTVLDSYVLPIQPRGKLTIEYDRSYAIVRMDFDAWVRENPFFADTVVTLEYTPNGARYEFFSLQTNDIYYVTFLRRAPRNDSFDPATIFLIEFGDGTLMQLDYRYVE